MIVLDASALVSLFVADGNSVAIKTYFRSTNPRVGVNDFAAAEFASAISIRLRSKQIPLSEATGILAAFDAWVSGSAKAIALAPEDSRAAAAMVRRFELGLRAPDALHLAICLRLGVPLLTYDIRQMAAARALGIRLALPQAHQAAGLIRHPAAGIVAR